MTDNNCSICKRKITDESLYCRFCNAVFCRKCIITHFYYNRFCPACKKDITFIDLKYGAPQPEQGLPSPSPPKTIRKPRWPQWREIPLFDRVITPSPSKTDYLFNTYTPAVERGFFSRLKGAVSSYVPRGALKGFKKNKKGMAGVYMLAAAVVIAVLAPVLIRYDPALYLAEEMYVYHPPTWKYVMGTDVFGRDIYSQTVWGFRSALIIAVPSALLVGIIGTVVGLVSGYYSGIVDIVLQRISTAFLVWPSVPLVALIVFSWGPTHALLAVILGVAFTLWPTTARGIRAEVLSLKTRAFIDAAKVAGASPRRIVFRHILPSVIHITFLYMTIAVASALVLEATFNFLGLTNPAVVTWGQMLSFTYHSSIARYGVGGGMGWWTILPPATAIAYMVLSFFLITTGMRESMRIMPVQF